MIRKFIFFWGWIGIALISLIGIAFSFFHWKIDLDINKIVYTKEFVIGLFGVSFFYLLLFIDKTLCLFIREEKNFIIENETGKVLISPASINSIIVRAIENYGGVKNIKVVPKNSKKGINIDIKLEVESEANLTEKLMSMQKTIKEEIKEKINLEVNRIDIKAAKLMHNNDVKVKPKFRGEEDEVGQ